MLRGLGHTPSVERLVNLGLSIASFMDATCDYDPNDATIWETNKKRLESLQANHIEALCLAERDMPESEFSRFVHNTLHFAGTTGEGGIEYWNGVRNSWCFVPERFLGFCKGFIKNRSLAVQNLVSMYCFVLFF